MIDATRAFSLGVLLVVESACGFALTRVLKRPAYIECVPFVAEIRAPGVAVRAQINMDGSITVSDWAALAAFAAGRPHLDQARFLLAARGRLREADEAEAGHVNARSRAEDCVVPKGFARLMSQLTAIEDGGPEL